MQKFLALWCITLLVYGCSDPASFLDKQGTKDQNGLNIIKSFDAGINLVEDDNNTLKFSYPIDESCGGGIGYYDEAYSLTLDKELNTNVEKLGDLVDPESLYLDLYESGNNIADVVGLEDKNYVYVIAIPKSALSCDDVMYYDSKSNSV